MCGFIEAAAVLSLASGAAGFIQQDQLANATRSHQGAMQERNMVLAKQSAIRQYEDLFRRQREEEFSSDTQTTDLARQTQAALSTARTEAAEGGVAGASVAALGQAYRFQQGQQTARINSNQKFVDSQLSSQLLAITQNRYAQELGLAQQPVASPSLLGAALNTGADLSSLFFQSSLNK